METLVAFIDSFPSSITSLQTRENALRALPVIAQRVLEQREDFGLRVVHQSSHGVDFRLNVVVHRVKLASRRCLLTFKFLKDSFGLCHDVASRNGENDLVEKIS